MKNNFFYSFLTKFLDDNRDQIQNVLINRMLKILKKNVEYINLIMSKNCERFIKLKCDAPIQNCDILPSAHSFFTFSQKTCLI